MSYKAGDYVNEEFNDPAGSAKAPHCPSTNTMSMTKSSNPRVGMRSDAHGPTSSIRRLQSLLEEDADDGGTRDCIPRLALPAITNENLRNEACYDVNVGERIKNNMPGSSTPVFVARIDDLMFRSPYPHYTHLVAYKTEEGVYAVCGSWSANNIGFEPCKDMVSIGIWNRDQAWNKEIHTDEDEKDFQEVYQYQNIFLQ